MGMSQLRKTLAYIHPRKTLQPHGTVERPGLQYVNHIFECLLSSLRTMLSAFEHKATSTHARTHARTHTQNDWTGRVVAFAALCI